MGALLEEEPSLEGSLVRVASGLRQPQSFLKLAGKLRMCLGRLLLGNIPGDGGAGFTESCPGFTLHHAWV